MLCDLQMHQGISCEGKDQEQGCSANESLAKGGSLGWDPISQKSPIPVPNLGKEPAEICFHKQTITSHFYMKGGTLHLRCLIFLGILHVQQHLEPCM